VSGSVFQQEHVGRGAALADYDNDGEGDVILVHQQCRPMLLSNDGVNQNNWLKVRVKRKRIRQRSWSADDSQ